VTGQQGETRLQNKKIRRCNEPLGKGMEATRGNVARYYSAKIGTPSLTSANLIAVANGTKENEIIEKRKDNQYKRGNGLVQNIRNNFAKEKGE